MEILIWGTGAKGRETKRVCDKMGWPVRAFIDNDDLKWGGVFEGIPVISPDDTLSMWTNDTQVWIASGDDTLYKQARHIVGNVLGWEFVELILRSQKERTVYSEVQLKSCNIQNCQLVEDREALLHKFTAESSGWKMAEAGVAYGEFSEQILKICFPQKLYLIDSWEGERYGNGLEVVRNRFKHQIEREAVEICRGNSIQKLEEFGDGELDWIYIDTAHTYETTKKELELCRRKVKQEGYICGHDYAKYNVYSRCDYGVYDAVNEFAVKEGYEFIYLTMEMHGLQSFALRKIMGD